MSIPEARSSAAGTLLSLGKWEEKVQEMSTGQKARIRLDSDLLRA